MSCDLQAEDAAYLTNVMAGVEFSFVCRMPGCMFFGLNDGKTWVKEKQHYWFKCPRCGEQYRPSSGKKEAVKANYVLPSRTR